MNVDEILSTLNQKEVDYLLIGGMNFLLLHVPELTFDVDIWVNDDPQNLSRLNSALHVLGGEWGRTEAEWKKVSVDWHWLQSQGVFCLTTAHGALDVFRDVHGLEGRYLECKARAVRAQTATGIPFLGLSDPESPAGCRTKATPNGRAPRCHAPSPRGVIQMDLSELKKQEERKRESAYDPVKRWQHIQQTITWAEANLPAHLRRNRPRAQKGLRSDPK